MSGLRRGSPCQAQIEGQRHRVDEQSLQTYGARHASNATLERASSIHSACAQEDSIIFTNKLEEAKASRPAKVIVRYAAQ